MVTFFCFAHLIISDWMPDTVNFTVLGVWQFCISIHILKLYNEIQLSRNSLILWCLFGVLSLHTDQCRAEYLRENIPGTSRILSRCRLFPLKYSVLKTLPALVSLNPKLLLNSRCLLGFAWVTPILPLHCSLEGKIFKKKKKKNNCSCHIPVLNAVASQSSQIFNRTLVYSHVCLISYFTNIYPP